MKNTLLFIAYHIRHIVICLIAIITFSMCNPSGFEGTVVDKQHTPAKTMKAPSINASNGELTSDMQEITTPDKWKVCLRDSIGKSKWFEIDQEQYDTLRIGQHLVLYR